MRRRDLPTQFGSAAPMRLDFAGAWTDVAPFSAREGGVVVNGAIGLRAHVDLKLGETGGRLKLVSEELGETFECANAGGLDGGGKLGLLKAALRMFPVLGGCTVTSRCDAPPGSGLGSSGALGVALVAALSRARLEPLAERELAEHAWLVETVEAGIPGGKQDQYAASLGGFHRLTFRDPDVDVEPVTLDREFAAELQRHMLLCYTNTSRVSGDTIARVMRAYEGGDPSVTGALRALKEIAERMTEALRGADLARVGALLDDNWARQQALDPAMRTAEMARLERAVKEAGGMGGKAAGAGAGGSMFFVVRNAAAAGAAARAAGATVLPLAWAGEGARAW